MGNRERMDACLVYDPGEEGLLAEQTAALETPVVTRDIPAGVVVAGAPCRVLREIGERDRQSSRRDRPLDVPLA